MIFTINTPRLAVLRYYSVRKPYVDENPEISGPDNYKETFGFIGPLTRPKGTKLLKTREFFHGLFTLENCHPTPVLCEVQELGQATVQYELPDNFDPALIQILDVTYELNRLPAWKVADYILYDGEKVPMIQDPAGYTIRPGFEFHAGGFDW